jgi:hypothetical protein
MHVRSLCILRFALPSLAALALPHALVRQQLRRENKASSGREPLSALRRRRVPEQCIWPVEHDVNCCRLREVLAPHHQETPGVE